MMGSEGKSRKRRSSDSPPPSQDEEERSRKHRKREERESKSRKDNGNEEKKDKKKKSKSEKSHKHSRSRDGKEKKSGKKHKSKRKIQELTGDDYFSKNNEFSTWLKEEKGLFFSDLSSESARDLFSSFVKDWNRQKLGSQYYEGIARGPRTTHNWNIRQGKEFSGL